jgi:hypothetical protein
MRNLLKLSGMGMVLLLGACSGSVGTGRPDASRSPNDAAAGVDDAAPPGADSGFGGDAGASLPADAGASETDAGASSDAGTHVDGGHRSDAGAPGLPDTDRPLGAPCALADMCMDTDRCFHGWNRAVFPEGFCARTCRSGDECGADAACVLPRRDRGLCAPQCDSVGDCRAGYECRSEPALGGEATDVCVPVPSDGPAPIPVGAPCEANHECGRGRCLDGVPDGYCTGDCDPSGDGSVCGDGAECVAIRVRLTIGTGIVGLCGIPCRDATDCRTGYACETWENAVSDDTHCLWP